jgi:hypothetical protein
MNVDPAVQFSADCDLAARIQKRRVEGVLVNAPASLTAVTQSAKSPLWVRNRRTTPNLAYTDGAEVRL